MTLKGVKQEAYLAGRRDAMTGRGYRDSFEHGSRLRNMGLYAEYDAGWKVGRNHPYS